MKTIFHINNDVYMANHLRSTNLKRFKGHCMVSQAACIPECTCIYALFAPTFTYRGG